MADEVDVSEEASPKIPVFVPRRRRSKLGRDVGVPLLAILAVVIAIVVVERLRVSPDGAGGTTTVVGTDGFTPIKLGIASGGSSGIGKAAPTFQLLDPQGGLVGLTDFRGKPVLVNFWATWCVPCQREIPDLLRLQAEWGDAVQIIGIDLNEPADVVADYAAGMSIIYPLPLDLDGSVTKAYRLTGLPESFFLDRFGVVRDHRIGVLRAAVARCIIANLQKDNYDPHSCQ